MNATDVVAYTYATEQWTPRGVIEIGIREGWLAPAARDIGAEAALDQAQHYVGVDRYDEYSYDSSTFPKVIFGDQVTEDDLFRDEHGRYVKLG